MTRVATLLLVLASTSPTLGSEPDISSEALMKHVRYLASPELGGRGDWEQRVQASSYVAKALRELKARVYDRKRQEEQQKRADQRKTLIGSGDRSQRIRTYNFPENRVTDHRINFTLYKLDQVIAGNLQPVTDALIDYDREQLRRSFSY